MKKIRFFVVLFFGLLLISSCAAREPLLPWHMVSGNEKDNIPIVIFVHGAGDGDDHNTIPRIDTTLVSFQYSYLDGTDKNSERFLKEFIKFKNKHYGKKIVIAAHSYGCCVTVAAIQEDTGNNFKDIPVILLSPVIMGATSALGKSEPFYQFWMWTISPFRDYRHIATSEDPEGPIIPRLISNFPLFEERVRQVSIFFEDGDEFIPDEDSPEIIKKNFQTIRTRAIELPRNGDKDPHTDIIERKEVRRELEKFLLIS